MSNPPKKPGRTASEVGKSNVRNGKSHERRMAHLLTEFTGQEFRRRRVTGRDQGTIDRESTSDVISSRGLCAFSIEGKAGKGFSLDALMASPDTSLFTKWWFQATYDANLLTNAIKKPIYPMVMFKPIPAWDWVAVSKKGFSEQLVHKGVFPIILYEGFGNRTYTMSVSHGDRTKQIIDQNLDDVVFCRWKTFAENIDADSLFYVR
jgi:hypothetical protein